VGTDLFTFKPTSLRVLLCNKLTKSTDTVTQTRKITIYRKLSI